MKRYVLRILGFALLLLPLHWAILAGLRAPIPAEYWVRDFIVVKAWMGEQITQPKIILAGGSSTLFGIDAVAVERALGRPVVNEGIHAGLRLETILDQARRVARPGDVIVLSLEPELYTQSEAWDGFQLRNALAWDPGFDQQPTLEKWNHYAEAGSASLDRDLVTAALEELLAPRLLQNRELHRQPDDQILARYLDDHGTATSFEYSVRNLDPRGDIQHTESTGMTWWGPASPVDLPRTISPHVAQLLGAFLAGMKTRQVRVFIAHTPYQVDGPPGVDWQKAEATWATRIVALGGEILDRRDDLFYSRNLIFDTRYHLNAQGRTLRTQLLIRDLRAHLGLLSPP